MELFIVLLIVGLPFLLLIGTIIVEEGFFEYIADKWSDRMKREDKRMLAQAKSKYDEAWAEYHYTEDSGINLHHVAEILCDQLKGNARSEFRSYEFEKGKFQPGDERWQLKS
jgi:hypothetical protein